jgi:leucyl-tRNA synthetase
MEWLNDAISQDMKLTPETAQMVIVALSTMAPHICSELLEVLFSKELAQCSWPSYDQEYVYENEVTVVVQVNSKVRANIVITRNASRESVESLAKEAVAKWLAGLKIVKVVYVPEKLVNFVVQS